MKCEKKYVRVDTENGTSAVKNTEIKIYTHKITGCKFWKHMQSLNVPEQNILINGLHALRPADQLWRLTAHLKARLPELSPTVSVWM
jgi:hypothetical protein